MDIKFRAWHKKEGKLYFRAYQKLFHVLLCENDFGKNEGKGTPVKRAGYEDCVLLQGTTIEDLHGQEIFEGDIVRITAGGETFEGILEEVPDMFKSRRLHPLHFLLKQFGIEKQTDLEFEIVGNCYESMSKIPTPTKSF